MRLTRLMQPMRLTQPVQLMRLTQPMRLARLAWPVRLARGGHDLHDLHGWRAAGMVYNGSWEQNNGKGGIK